MNKHGENFIDFVATETNGKYIVLGEYVKSSVKIKIKHIVCGHEYEVRPNDFKSGCRCPICANIGRQTKRRKTTFSEDVKLVVGDEYTFIDEYVNYHTKLNVIHNQCGEKYEVSPANFLKGKRCPTCSIVKRAKKRARTTDDFIKEVYAEVKGEYEVLGEYENSITPIKIQHKECGHVYKVTPSNFLKHGKRCPKCRYSRGEKRVRDFLELHNFKFAEQHRFSDCTLTKMLVFDFVIFDDINKITHAIEYDGEFHFFKLFRTEDKFRLQKMRDKKKNDYCKEKDIKLIRIPYQQFNNIEKILSAKLNVNTTIMSQACAETAGRCND
ncbi:endonuclease domain-containing protein [Bacillus pretiosus]|uniref:Endonuclease domain-containing protein n=1 Tax=Bacillus pretiosus TaxID=2983392 RepID=A0ABT3EQW6_9BACI|nr:endonuclease domain-containing protein [Bacillus pretiosus]MCW1239217.1 endonuclease domain-containing protein [Bacillus pretiosus]